MPRASGPHCAPAPPPTATRRPRGAGVPDSRARTAAPPAEIKARGAAPQRPEPDAISAVRSPTRGQAGVCRLVAATTSCLALGTSPVALHWHHRYPRIQAYSHPTGGDDGRTRSCAEKFGSVQLCSRIRTSFSACSRLLICEVSSQLYYVATTYGTRKVTPVWVCRRAS
jgi:hypothetical protein